MSNQRNIVLLIKSISGQSNVLTIPRLYLDLVKSHRSALLLSQCVYWSDKTKDPDGWFYKTYAEWYAELGMPRGAIDTAMKGIEKYVSTKVGRVGPTPKKHYKVNMDLLVSDISDLLESDKSEVSETDKSDLSENSKSTYTKTTTKTTITNGAKPTRPRNPLFDAISKVCQIDPTINGNGSSIGKVCSALAGANPPYTPEEVIQWGDAQGWRATPPTIWQLQQGIGSVRGKNNSESYGRFDGVMEYLKDAAND